MLPDLDCFSHSPLYLAIPSAVKDSAWQQSRRLATPASQWQGYLNQLCLDTVMAWILENWEAAAKPMVPAAAWPSFWELVTGSAVLLATQKIVLIPTEATDSDELRVPQEWIDIPTWRGGTYWGVQIEPDEGWLRVFGVASHQQLRQSGSYNWRDRTYALAEPDLIADLSVLRVASQLSTEIATQADSEPLPALTTAQGRSLIQRLSSPELPQPRLAVPFPQWAALVAHGGWRQQLAERRWGLPEQRQMTVWLSAGIRQIANQLGWQQIDWQVAASTSRGTAPQTAAVFSREISIEHVPYELRVVPIEVDSNHWRFELRCLIPGRTVAAGIRFFLLSEDLQPFEGNEEVAEQAVEQLEIDIRLEPGEGIVWGTVPSPDQYDVEILRFGHESE